MTGAKGQSLAMSVLQVKELKYSGIAFFQLILNKVNFRLHRLPDLFTAKHISHISKKA
jgi:hypothetical protein